MRLIQGSPVRSSSCGFIVASLGVVEDDEDKRHDGVEDDGSVHGGSDVGGACVLRGPLVGVGMNVGLDCLPPVSHPPTTARLRTWGRTMQAGRQTSTHG